MERLLVEASDAVSEKTAGEDGACMYGNGTSEGDEAEFKYGEPDKEDLFV